MQGKTALVTGASRGIGRAVAIDLARRGATVACVSTREGGCDETVAACESVGGAAYGLACNVADPEQVDALAKAVLEKSGGIYALINNAGITRDGVFLRMSTEDFDQVLDTNLRGAFLLCKAFARPLTKAREGRIVNVGSIVGIRGNAGQANYAASKAGLTGLTKSLAQELGSRGVTANLVAPGYIETDMTSALPEEARKSMLTQIPLGRLGSPEDVAHAVSFLCSEDAAYVTGQVLVVDGGMTM